MTCEVFYYVLSDVIHNANHSYVTFQKILLKSKKPAYHQMSNQKKRYIFALHIKYC